MLTILRDAGLSALDRQRLAGAAGRRLPVHGGPALVSGRVAAVPGHQGRADLSAGTRTGRVTVLREHTGAANGQTFAKDGRIVFCEQNGRRVSRMDRDGGRVETVAETWSGARLNSPNDIVARSDGLLFFTDPPYGVEPDKRSLHFQGVYALDIERREDPTSPGFSPTISRNPTAWRSRPTSGPSTSATRHAITSGPSRSRLPANSRSARAGSSRPLIRRSKAAPTG